MKCICYELKDLSITSGNFQYPKLRFITFFSYICPQFQTECGAKIVISHESTNKISKKITKMNENISRLETIHERIALCVKELGEGKNTVFALNIGVSEGNIRGYIKGVVPKADVLEKIVRCYDVDAEWLLTGKGEMRKTKRISGGVCTDGEHTPDTDTTNKSKQNIPESKENTSIIAQLLDTIKQQAEEIGQLKALIADLEQRIRAAEDTHTEKAAG